MVAFLAPGDAARADHLRDPLLATTPGRDRPHPASYWAATAGPPPADDGALEGDVETDVAIMGGGYTGLSCALHLAARHGIRARVLEANRFGWGCSGRNGSFARPAIGRVPYGQWVERWGVETARAVFQEALQALETVRGLIAAHGIACDVQPDGWLKLAHRPGRAAALKAEQQVLRDVFGFEVEFLDAERLKAEHFIGGEAFGALRWPISFAMHPLKLTYGLAAAARAQGAVLHPATPVTAWRKRDDWHELQTPNGTVRARRVVVATNGYTLERLFPRFRGQLLPVLSNIVVTTPLSDAEIADGNFVTTDVMTDTREMLYYFRRLPDNRIMLGGKGPPRDDPAANERHCQHLLQAVRTKFPFARAPKAAYFWGGWVALTPDFIPHVTSAEDDPSIVYGLGYMGSGVSFSIHAGLRMAQLLAGEAPSLPGPVASTLPRFPMAAFRRQGQRLMMQWYALKDRRD